MSVEFDESVQIARSSADVFAKLADIQVGAGALGSPVVTMEKLPAEPTQVGTRWREVVRLAPGPRMIASPDGRRVGALSLPGTAPPGGPRRPRSSAVIG